MPQAAARTAQEQFPLLRTTQLARYLSEHDLVELEALCRPLTRRPWGSLFRQGERAGSLYLVAEGSVELRARPPGRRLYRTVEVVRSGCTVGDEAVVGEGEYLFSARALEPARLLSLDRRSFDRLTEERPHLAVGVARCSGSCLIQTVRRAAVLTQAPADVALRHLLSELAAANDAADRAVSIRITHTQLAGVLHVSRETVTRLLGQLAGEGGVQLGRGVIRVLR